VTPEFYDLAERMWGPLPADWHSILARRFTTEELQLIAEFLRASNQIGHQHLDRLREMG
jgi:hypothetical protein